MMDMMDMSLCRALKHHCRGHHSFQQPEWRVRSNDPANELRSFAVRSRSGPPKHHQMGQ